MPRLAATGFRKVSKRLFNTERTRWWVIIQLDFDVGGGDLDAGETITITFGGLTIATAGTADMYRRRPVLR